jgi:excisionase family DNA binding protein
MTEKRAPEYGEVFTPEELADYLKVGRTYAYRLLATREVSSFTIGRLRRIRRQDAERYVEKRARAAGAR